MKISITRALVELKNYEDKINRAITGGLYVSHVVGQNQNQKVATGKSVEQTTQMIQSSLDKVNALMNNRAKLKAAIVKSNATTMVTILGNEMTVAEAIELKTQLPLMENLRMHISSQLSTAKRTVELANAKMEETIDKHLTTVYGNDKSKVSEDVMKAVRSVQEQQMHSRLLDPIGIEEVLNELQEKTAKIRGEIDFSLSESNARTEIEVDL